MNILKVVRYVMVLSSTDESLIDYANSSLETIFCIKLQWIITIHGCYDIELQSILQHEVEVVTGHGDNEWFSLSNIKMFQNEMRELMWSSGELTPSSGAATFVKQVWF